MEFAKQFHGAVALENDIMVLIGIKHGEDEPLREFVKRYLCIVLDLRAFNHPQTLRELKE